MFPPSYGWKDLFNLRCVFLGDQLGLWFVWWIWKSKGVSSLVKRSGSSGPVVEWGSPTHKSIPIQVGKSMTGDLPSENAFEKLTNVDVYDTKLDFVGMWAFQWCQQSQECSDWGHVSTVWSIYVMLGYILMVPMISTWKDYMYIKQWSHQSHDTFRRSAIFMVKCHWIWMLWGC